MRTHMQWKRAHVCVRRVMALYAKPFMLKPIYLYSIITFSARARALAYEHGNHYATTPQAAAPSHAKPKHFFAYLILSVCVCS